MLLCMLLASRLSQPGGQAFSRSRNFDTLWQLAVAEAAIILTEGTASAI